MEPTPSQLLATARELIEQAKAMQPKVVRRKKAKAVSSIRQARAERWRQYLTGKNKKDKGLPFVHD